MFNNAPDAEMDRDESSQDRLIHGRTHRHYGATSASGAGWPSRLEGRTTARRLGGGTTIPGAMNKKAGGDENA
jgi:hypothetical protein